MRGFFLPGGKADAQGGEPTAAREILAKGNLAGESAKQRGAI